MKKYFAYIRVSTVKQGEKGSSLSEQKDAILRYADKHNLTISTWFEELETAAKRGRTIFRRMMTEIKKGKAHGLIMHKVDRGARNLADWAELASLMDLGIDVHFAHEAIDLQTRGGRLSADIQAVVASDYIRNLRQEVRKGMDGRLKAGLFPFNAPTGYDNNGKGAAKTISKVQGPLVRLAFEIYANEDESIRSLLPRMTALGLRAKTGGPLSLPAFAKMLQNPFYYGLIISNGKAYPGIHQPIITKELFDRVRAKAEGKAVRPHSEKIKAEFLLRGLIVCKACNRHLYGERQKGFVYYRCPPCRGTCVREDALFEAFLSPLSFLDLLPSTHRMLGESLHKAQSEKDTVLHNLTQSLRLQLAQIDSKLSRLTDLYLEGSLDSGEYQSKKITLTGEKLAKKTEIGRVESGVTAPRAEHFPELVKALETLRQTGKHAQIRSILKQAVPNWYVEQKNIDIHWSKSMSMLLDLAGVSCGAPEPSTSRRGKRKVTDCSAAAFEKRFRQALADNAEKIYETIISDHTLDYWPPHA